MFERRSLKLPITLGVVMIVLLVALTIGWVLMAIFGALQDSPRANLYWAMLSIGSATLIFILVGVSIYLGLSVRAVNLSRRQANFMDSVTHELKSPIASLKLYLQTLNRRQVTPEERADFYRFMLDDVERLDGLFTDLLAAARLTHEWVAPTNEISDLAGVITESARAVSSRYHLAPEAILLATEPCPIVGRRGDLDLILRNLIDNAVKYGGDPPEVQVALKRHADRAVVTVADNGAGVPRKHRRKIFGRFVRLGEELERRQPGTGLGLHIVHTLVGRLNGQISVRDRTGQTGAEFVLVLPASSETVTSEGTTMNTPSNVSAPEIPTQDGEPSQKPGSSSTTDSPPTIGSSSTTNLPHSKTSPADR